MTPNGLEMNKIAAAILLAGIIAMVSGITAEVLYGGSGHSEHAGEEPKRGYTIEVAEDTGGAGGEAEEAKGPVDITPFLATADLEAGEKLLKRCTSCHTFDKGGKDGVGPNQWALLGRKVASHEGFAYSDAMKAHGGSWGFQELSDFLENPKKAAPGNKMAFAGLKKPQDRANLIAYINTLSDSPLPLPK